MLDFREPFAAALPPGLGEARREADVEVAGRRLAERADRPVRRRRDPHLHPLPGPRRPGHRLDTGRHRRDGSFRPSALARRARGRRTPAVRAGVDTPLARKAHETIARVSDDIDRRFVFNTPIAAVMELINELSKAPDDPAARFAAETAVSLLQPYTPHVAEELWLALGHERLWEHPWPTADPAMLERDTIELVLQVNGKVRDRVQAPAGLSEEEMVALAKASAKVRAHLNGEERAGDRRARQARQHRRLAPSLTSVPGYGFTVERCASGRWPSGRRQRRDVALLRAPRASARARTDAERPPALRRARRSGSSVPSRRRRRSGSRSRRSRTTCASRGGALRAPPRSCASGWPRRSTRSTRVSRDCAAFAPTLRASSAAPAIRSTTAPAAPRISRAAAGARARPPARCMSRTAIRLPARSRGRRSAEACSPGRTCCTRAGARPSRGGGCERFAPSS